LVALQLLQIINKILALVDCNRDIRVKLGDTGSGDFSTRLANVFCLEEELGRQIGNSDGCGVVEGEGLDTGESNVLG